jgi:hypothetical protein
MMTIRFTDCWWALSNGKRDSSEIEDYELVVRLPGAAQILATYVALAP